MDGFGRGNREARQDEALRSEAPRGWGGVARRGAAAVRRGGGAGTDKDHPDPWARGPAAAPPPMDEWVRVRDDAPVAAPPSLLLRRSAAPTRPRPADGAAANRPPQRLPADVVAEIRKAAADATPHRRDVLVEKMEDAALAYERGRDQEALRLAKLVAGESPGVAAVRELAGLAAYRSGRWREAIRQLEAYQLLTGDLTHVPELMDAHRALGKRRKVADLWSEVRRESPGADVLAEARIVAAATLADQGDLSGAVSLLVAAGAAKTLRNPSDRHLRQWFALGDLYERAGDVPRAREFYARVDHADPGAYGVQERLAARGPERPRRPQRNRKKPVAASNPEEPSAGND